MLLALWLNVDVSTPGGGGGGDPDVTDGCWAPIGSWCPIGVASGRHDTHDGAGGVWQDRKRLRAIEEARARRWREELAELNELAAELRGIEEPEEIAPVMAQVAAVKAAPAPEAMDTRAFDAYMAALEQAIVAVKNAIQAAMDDEDEDEDLLLMMEP